MQQIAVEVPVNIDQLLNRLSPEQQRIVSDKLWALRIERLSKKMRAAVKKNGITSKEIKKWCEEARQKVYEKYRR